LEQLPVRLLNEQKDNLFLLYKNEVNKINFQNNPIILTSHQDENLIKEIINQAFQENKQINIHRREGTLNSSFIIIQVNSF
jgi:hypothetical protein